MTSEHPKWTSAVQHCTQHVSRHRSQESLSDCVSAKSSAAICSRALVISLTSSHMFEYVSSSACGHLTGARGQPSSSTSSSRTLEAFCSESAPLLDHETLEGGGGRVGCRLELRRSKIQVTKLRAESLQPRRNLANFPCPSKTTQVKRWPSVGCVMERPSVSYSVSFCVEDVVMPGFGVAGWSQEVTAKSHTSGVMSFP